MTLDAEQRALLAHLAADPHSRIVAFRISTDPQTGEAVLACVLEYFAGAEQPIGPPRLQPLGLVRGGDEHALWELAKSLAAEHGVPIQDRRRSVRPPDAGGGGGTG